MGDAREGNKPSGQERLGLCVNLAMIMSDVTIVYSFRDKPVGRLINSVDSIRQYVAGRNSKFIVVDYGSTEKYRQLLNSACEAAGIEVIRSETEGRPWSRAIAMNIGILAAKTDIFISTDIDMIFDFDVISEVLGSVERKVKVHCRPYWLPPSGNKKKGWLDGKSALGACMAMYVGDYKSIGGFNERIKFWGAEDSEFDLRARKLGYVTRWLPENLKMYHVWHPVSHGFCDIRPIPSIIEDQTLMLRTLVRDKDPIDCDTYQQGVPLKFEDRPILNFLRNYEFEKIRTFSQPINYKLINQVIDDLKVGRVVFVKTGSRIKYEICGNGVVGWFLIRFFHKIDRVLGRVGFHFGLKKNAGQDWIFLLIQELQPLIEDYYWDFTHGCYFYPRSFHKS